MSWCPSSKPETPIRAITATASSRSALIQAEELRPDGLPAVTEYEVLERLRGHTLLAVHPRTGRQHQIRVHLASIGHPLWGDLIYADESLFLRYAANGCRLDPSLPPRHGLHAERVRFRRPSDGRELELCAPLPEDLARVIAGLRAPQD